MTATLTGPLDPLRDGLARMIMEKVAGPDPRAERNRVHNTPGPRWFAPDRPIRRVHGDASMFAGGLRALLLQSLHPLAMAAVSAHSGYRGDPWGRLRRTSYFLAITTYGAIPDAEEAIARVQGVHQRVRGTSPDGVKYRASDPHLLKWVHLAEVDSFLRCYQLFGPEPLAPAEADEYVRQTGVVAAELGATSPPQTVRELDVRLCAFRPELHATAASRDAARFLLLDPPLPLAARPGYGLLAAGAVASLPGWARRELRLPPPFVAWDWPSLRLGAAGAGVVRWALSDASLVSERQSGSA